MLLPIILFINGVKVADCCKGLGIRPNSCEKELSISVSLPVNTHVALFTGNNK